MYVHAYMNMYVNPLPQKLVCIPDTQTNEMAELIWIQFCLKKKKKARPSWDC